MRALERIHDWPSESAAAGLRRPDGSIVLEGAVDQPFALASITKLLTAAALLVGVEEGSIELDEPQFDESVSLADLLGHAAGLSPEGTRIDRPWNRRIYSNAGYELAARALESATGIGFATYFDEAICQPLGMSSTALRGSPAHGAWSTVEDLLSFVEGLNRLLAPETIARMTSPHLPELVGVLPGYGRQAPNTWGLGPEIRSEKSPHWTGSRNSPATWGHFGQAGTFVWVDPLAEATLVVLTNMAFGDWVRDRWPELSDAVLEALGPNAKR